MNQVIIAEACQNHKGDLSILKDMIYAAKEAGADYIKIQSMLADELTQRERFEQGVIENGKVKSMKRPFGPEYERLKSMDLSNEAHVWFIEECQKADIKPLTTIFTYSRIEYLASLGWDEVKVASYDCSSFPFLKKLRKHFKHLFISTGSVTDSEIKEASEVLKGSSYSFLHCVTIYPTPLNEIHLRRIDWLRRFTPSVGFSDHTLLERDGLKASFAALYFDANVIERHFTVLDKLSTKDGPVSVDPDQLRELVEFSKLDKEQQKEYINEYVNEYDIMLGVETRELSDQELLNRDYYKGRFAAMINGKHRYNWEEG